MARKPILTVTEGPLKGKEFAVGNGYVIGRSEECEINTGDSTTSRRHAQINIERDGYRLVDLDSANGIWVNKRKLKSHFLQHGDEITLGDTTLRVAFVIDAKARRRSFLLFVLVLVVALGSILGYVWKATSEKIARNEPVVRDLDRRVVSEVLGFEVTVPSSSIQSERQYVRSGWMLPDGSFDLWGESYPVLGNGMIGDSVPLDSYQRMSFTEIIDEEYFEFTRFTIDAMGGLPRFANLLSFPLNDTSMPRSEPVEIEERLLESLRHAEYGDFEQAVKIVPAGVNDKDGAPVNFIYIQRCFVVGGRRYIVTFVTNASMLRLTPAGFEGRAATFVAELFDGFRIDVEAARKFPQVDDEKVFEEARAIMSEAEALGVSSSLNNMYRAMLRYIAAANKLKLMSREVNEYREAMSNVRRSRNRVEDALRTRRNEIRDRLNVRRYEDALIKIDELGAVVSSKDDPYAPPFTEQWAQWCEPARVDVNTEKNRPRF